ncbi:MAG: MaoC family dehydratase N-terminal domain-containing protein [Chloroflexota bacterium]
MLMPDGKITEEGLAVLRSRIGVDLRFKPHNEAATRVAILHFVRGIGDPNPLWVDEGYARKTRHRSIIAPPTFLSSVVCPTGSLAGGLPGVHSFFGGSDWEWVKTIRVDDSISARATLTDVVEKDHSQYAGKSVIQKVKVVYRNQYDRTIANVSGWTIRVERGAALARKKYASVKPTTHSVEYVDSVEDAYEKEEIRGSQIRYWDSVNVGDEISGVVKGPLTLGDNMCFNSGTFNNLCHGELLRYLERHPGYAFTQPQWGGPEPVFRVNNYAYAAQAVGINHAYDYGIDRVCWMGHAVTNWMGDDGTLKRLYVEVRRLNLFGDVSWCKGKVTKKYEQDGQYLVDLDVWAENHRGEITAPGNATVALLSKAVPGGHKYLTEWW